MVARRQSAGVVMLAPRLLCHVSPPERTRAEFQGPCRDWCVPQLACSPVGHRGGRRVRFPPEALGCNSWPDEWSWADPLGDTRMKNHQLQRACRYHVGVAADVAIPEPGIRLRSG